MIESNINPQKGGDQYISKGDGMLSKYYKTKQEHEK